MFITDFLWIQRTLYHVLIWLQRKLCQVSTRYKRYNPILSDLKQLLLPWFNRLWQNVGRNVLDCGETKTDSNTTIAHLPTFRSRLIFFGQNPDFIPTPGNVTAGSSIVRVSEYGNEVEATSVWSYATQDEIVQGPEDTYYSLRQEYHPFIVEPLAALYWFKRWILWSGEINFLLKVGFSFNY